MRPWWFVALVAYTLSACHHEPDAPPAAVPLDPTPKTVEVPMFGHVPIADGAIAIMDGGIEGVQGHTIVLPAQGAPTWGRRIDSMQPSGKPGSGQLVLIADEVARWREWRDSLWALAPGGTKSFTPPASEGPPRWVWAIVMRRGQVVRVLSGGAMASPSGAPEPTRSVLVWLVQRVDALGSQPM